MVEQGPPVNLLSAAQLRFLGRLKTLRPAAEMRWRGDSAGWSLDVVEQSKGAPDKPVLAARLDPDGTVETTRFWL